jgi:F0F1-type ATP synthase membrane subunit b/b'
MIIRRQQEILDEILRAKNPKPVLAVIAACCLDELAKIHADEDLRRIGHEAVKKARKIRETRKKEAESQTKTTPRKPKKPQKGGSRKKAQVTPRK